MQRARHQRKSQSVRRGPGRRQRRPWFRGRSSRRSDTRRRRGTCAPRPCRRANRTACPPRDPPATPASASCTYSRRHWRPHCRSLTGSDHSPPADMRSAASGTAPARRRCCRNCRSWCPAGDTPPHRRRASTNRLSPSDTPPDSIAETYDDRDSDVRWRWRRVDARARSRAHRACPRSDAPNLPAASCRNAVSRRPSPPRRLSRQGRQHRSQPATGCRGASSDCGTFDSTA